MRFCVAKPENSGRLKARPMVPLSLRVGLGIDVLNAQSQLYQTKRDLAQARYNVLLGNLKLRQAAGTLLPDDLAQLNSLLAK